MNLAKYPPSKPSPIDLPEPLFSPWELAQDRRCWNDLRDRNRELYEIRRRNAIAARELSRIDDTDPGYRRWLSEYQAAGQQLRAYQERPVT